MTKSSRDHLYELREKAMTEQMSKIDELVKLSTDPALTREIANQLADAVIHWTNYDRNIRDSYESTPEETKTFIQKLMRK
jgi:hypothetical protein